MTRRTRTAPAAAVAAPPPPTVVPRRRRRSSRDGDVRSDAPPVWCTSIWRLVLLAGWGECLRVDTDLQNFVSVSFSQDIDPERQDSPVDGEEKEVSDIFSFFYN